MNYQEGIIVGGHDEKSQQNVDILVDKDGYIQVDVDPDGDVILDTTDFKGKIQMPDAVKSGAPLPVKVKGNPDQKPYVIELGGGDFWWHNPVIKPHSKKTSDGENISIYGCDREIDKTFKQSDKPDNLTRTIGIHRANGNGDAWLFDDGRSFDEVSKGMMVSPVRNNSVDFKIGNAVGANGEWYWVQLPYWAVDLVEKYGYKLNVQCSPLMDGYIAHQWRWKGHSNVLSTMTYERIWEYQDKTFFSRQLNKTVTAPVPVFQVVDPYPGTKPDPTKYIQKNITNPFIPVYAGYKEGKIYFRIMGFHNYGGTPIRWYKDSKGDLMDYIGETNWGPSADWAFLDERPETFYSFFPNEFTYANGEDVSDTLINLSMKGDQQLSDYATLSPTVLTGSTSVFPFMSYGVAFDVKLYS